MDSYRSVMEVMRYVPVPDILLSTSIVTTLWTRVSQSNELWRSLCEDGGIDLEGGPAESAKEMYKEGDSQIPKLCVISQLSLTTYSIPQMEVQVTPLQLQITVDQFTAYCQISKNILLCCGGGAPGHFPISNFAYEVNSLTGQVAILSPMNCPRMSTGILKYRRFVYVFGGYHLSNLDSAEKYSLSSRNWSYTKGSMNVPMTAIVPCRYRKDVYLVGAVVVEVFSTVTEVFRQMKYELPMSWYCNLAVCTPGGELVIAQKHTILRVGVRDETIHSSKKIEIIENGNYWSNCIPVRDSSFYYSIENTHGTIVGILQLDVCNLTLQRVLSIQYEQN